MGNPTASEAEFKEALKKVKLYDFIKESGGLAMQLTEHAENLSGGQKQRLALARAILHDSDIYIFDEATSNIDVESEELIMKNIREMAKEKTIILISHRLANIVEADEIFMMENGSIIENGTQEELLQINSGNYKRLYESQKELEGYAKYTKESTISNERKAAL